MTDQQDTASAADNSLGAGTDKDRSGDMSAGRSEADDAAATASAGAVGTDAGSPGGMGGVRSQGGDSAGSGRPPGGTSPIEGEEDS